MGHGASVLPDGSVLVAGGHRWVDFHPDTSRTSETFDPVTGIWSPAGLLSTPRGEGATMVTLPDGRPVVIGGFWWSTVTPAPPGGMPSWSDSRYEGTAEVFTPSTRSWIQAAPMTRGRAGHISAVLADGTVLVAGGFNAGTLAERLDPAAIIHWTPPPSRTDPPPGSTPSGPETGRPAGPQRARGKLVFATPRPKRFVVGRSGKLAVRVKCIGAGDCSDRLVVTIAHRGGRRVLARTTAVVTLAHTERIRIGFSKRARRRTGRGPVRITATVSGKRLTRAVTVRKQRSSR
jgi:hypothetical protein